MSEVWASGDAYEPYVGRWSRLVAPEFLDWLAAPAHSRWMDIGCGTGALAAAVATMRAAAPDGVVAAYVWDYAGRMELMRHFWDAAVALDPAAADLDEGARFPICRPDRLEALWRGAGLTDVRSRAIDVPTAFRDFDDYWRPFLGGQAPAPAYAMSLDEERRDALRERLRTALPVAGDGSISLVARAWAVRGRSRL